jgi:hypothetical protein
VQPVVRAATRGFVDTHLKPDVESARLLTADGLRPFLGGVMDDVDVPSK